jgi:dTMP kinase
MFVTFEGIDGSGKSTQAKKFAEWLAGQNKTDVLLTREPGGWQGGEALRAMVLEGNLRHPWSEAFLFMLDRTEHAARVITPALAEGKTVLCERYHDSTLAYQVWGRGLPLEVFDMLAKEAKLPIPHLTIFFDIPVEIAMERAAKRGRLDAFEQEGASFMKKIRIGYQALWQRDPKRWLRIDCTELDETQTFHEALYAARKRGFFGD